jgi:AcrR family transcriptional regulator
VTGEGTTSGVGDGVAANHASVASGDEEPTNRDRVLEAAARVFAEQGLKASVPAIANAAGVGVGTIYRAFESKHDLIGALVADRINAHAEMAELALGSGDDAWEAFCDLMWRTASRQAEDYVTAEGLAAVYAQPAVLQARERAGVALVALIDAAKATGKLREDFSPADLGPIFAALAGAQHSVGRGNDAWKRILSMLIDGMRSDAATPMETPPLSAEELARAAEEERARQDL